MLIYFLCQILKILSSAILRKYRPFIIGITGNVGKTSTKEAAFCVLSRKFGVEKIRKSEKNYNNEIGAPLTIIGAESGGKNIFKWFLVFGRAIKLILFKNSNYPIILILEMGADKLGDIRYLTDFIHCQIGIITAIGDTPVHLESFKTPAQVAREKAILIQRLEEKDLAILNRDDEAVYRMANKTKAKVLTFGFNSDADIVASQIAVNDFLGETSGLSFKVRYNDKIELIHLNGVLGKHQIYPVLAAIGAGLRFKMDLNNISEALRSYVPPTGRMKIIKGIKKSWIIDDTYNASPSATFEALNVLKEIKLPENARKIAVLGDMLELGQFTERAHRKIGSQAAQIVDLLFTVGLRAKFIAEEAQKNGLSAKKIFIFNTADEAKLAVQEKIKKGDLILIKGSQGMRMEKITKEIMAEPERARELLVRQGKEWKG